MSICLIDNNRALSLFHHKTSLVEAAPLAAGGVTCAPGKSSSSARDGQ